MLIVLQGMDDIKLWATNILSSHALYFIHTNVSLYIASWNPVLTTAGIVKATATRLGMNRFQAYQAKTRSSKEGGAG